jgi:hypothetical protein
MLWPKGLDRDIDRDDATMPDLVKNHRQKESTSAEPSASLDHSIGSSPDQQLLANPHSSGHFKSLWPNQLRLIVSARCFLNQLSCFLYRDPKRLSLLGIIA